MKTTFDWPTPLYFTFAAGSDARGKETCLVQLLDGEKALGVLVRFAPAEAQVVLRPARGQSDETLAFARIRSVRMTRPLVMERDVVALETRARELVPPSGRQAYEVQFADNQVIEGETIGHVDSDEGLYLYLPVEGEKIVRCFIPRLAIASFRIGRPIGEMLVEKKLATEEAVEAALDRQHRLRAQRIGDYLAENEIVSREQLAQAIRHQESRPVLRLGEALLQLELLTQEQLDAALHKQKRNRRIPLGQILIEMGVVDERTLQGVLANKLGIPFVHLAKFNFDPNAIRLVKAATAHRRVLMPLCFQDNALVVAFENPLDALAIEELRFETQLKIVPAMASHKDILAAVREYYDAYGAFDRLQDMGGEQDGPDAAEDSQNGASDARIGELASKLLDLDAGMEVADEPVAESDNVLVQLVNKMIMDAYHGGVSDIHIETFPGKQKTRVRFRKDGTLVDYLQIPSNFRNAVVSRIKIMAQLDISERRKPQDGKIDFQQFGPARIELRVATIPTANGLEDVVMRVLVSARPIPIDKLGLAPDILLAMKRVVQKPYGFILVCGPTGSGKTTTLHSLLSTINTTGRKIWTAEDPIEITQPGLRQVQVNAKIGWTFAAAMRSFLRADPDVIMIGEMRDEETTKVGIEASLTGHLVLSTLHTNSAPESVVRLLDLGMDPFNFADALLVVLAQRLAKALCPKCKEAYAAEPAEIAALAAEYCAGTALDPAAIAAQWRAEPAHAAGFTLYRANGCESCNHTGYKGRLPLHELLTVTPAIRRMIQQRATISDLVPAAAAGGMRTLKQDGLLKVLQGRTDVAQVRAVCV
ncbi:MAG: Flp pilus assembly complex ATPase component TadA [Betaproteobacteria bacterium]|nr:Flp pilus assembly complex ATPase component TadA [Betaproteobacteria bacterium]